MDRREAIAKATTDTSVATGGLLNPSQSTRFIEVLKDSSDFSRNIRVEPVDTPDGELNKIATGSRIIRAAQENADDGYRAQPSFPTVDYDTTKIRLPWEVTEEVYEENIEKRQLEDRLMNLMGTQFGLDLDDLDINGDTAAGAGPDQAFLQIHDGILKLIDNDAAVHDVDGSTINGGALAKDHFFAGIAAMPDKFINAGGLRWLMAPSKVYQWYEYLTERATGAGDAALTGTGPAADAPLKIPFLPLTFWPADRIVLANPKNFMRTVFRQIKRRRVTPDTDWELATRDKTGYIFFMREGITYEDGDAIVNIHTLDA